MTQARLAELAGLSINCVNRIENGKQRIIAEWVPQIAAALGLTIAQLYGEGESGPGDDGEIIVGSSDDIIILITPGALERFNSDANCHAYRARGKIVSVAEHNYRTRISDKMQQEKLDNKVIA